MTNYEKLHAKTLWLVLGWSMIVILMNCSSALFLKVEHNCDIVTAMLFIFLLNYSFHINVVDDLTNASILGLVSFYIYGHNMFIILYNSYMCNTIKLSCINHLTVLEVYF